MGTTSKYGWHYPGLADAPNGAAQMEQLAEDIEGTVDDVDTAVKSIAIISAGQVTVTPTTSTSNSALGTYYRGTAAVTLPAGRFSGSPAVTLSANSGSPGSVLEVSPSSLSASGFIVNVARAESGTATIVYWIAVSQTQ